MSRPNSHPSMHRSRCAQRGVVLVVALIFLLLITLLALSASGHTLLQERMAGNLRDAQKAEMAAEMALRGAEWRLWKASSDSAASNCGTTVIVGCYSYDPANPIAHVENFRASAGWVIDGATEYKGSSGSYDYTTLNGSSLSAAEKKLAALAKNPRYIIEDLGPEVPPGAGAAHESGVTSSAGAGPTSTGRRIYRITARATGGGPSIRVLESTFAGKAQ
ncbi:pilus assembly PilX family protein [Dyella tabacisoli]|uniref:pilus assembly PilX family protein n=1 Tax=Dyella tabacisoli TaxID=2282381 RepID=UPI0013B3A8D7|nr:PilX N-terminal domain-containing pilus assembly protein [Dyella tabacisoli]